MFDQSQFDFPTHVAKETQTRTVRGGVIVILIARLVRDSDGASVATYQEDCVATDGKAAAALVADHLNA